MKIGFNKGYTCFQGQPFGENYNDAYKKSGLAGHTGEDWSCGWHSPIYSEYDGIVYKVLDKDHPANDGSGFTGVFMIVDNGIECFEWLEGHCDPAVAVGQAVKRGDLLGYEANHGMVFSGNVQITLDMQAAGDQRGHHRHVQKRPVKPVKKYEWPCLSAGSDQNGSYLSPEGFYYRYWDPQNGFNGCVDPSLPVFHRDLTLGATGYDVWVLQRLLKNLGFFNYPEATGYFGFATLLAVRNYQKSKGITPTLGYFGPITLKSVLSLLPPPPELGDW